MAKAKKHAKKHHPKHKKARKGSHAKKRCSKCGKLGHNKRRHSKR